MLIVGLEHQVHVVEGEYVNDVVDVIVSECHIVRLGDRLRGLQRRHQQPGHLC